MNSLEVCQYGERAFKVSTRSAVSGSSGDDSRRKSRKSEKFRTKSIASYSLM